jgi:hypothetical protein
MEGLIVLDPGAAVPADGESLEFWKAAAVHSRIVPVSPLLKSKAYSRDSQTGGR